MREFVPVADNCSYTQSQQDAKGEFFRIVAEQGHYAGRTLPTGTRQGLYTCTAAGELLASINTRDADRVAEMMRLALEKWHQQPAKVIEEVASSYHPDPRMSGWQYPADGLVLNLYVRDLPREDGEIDLRWNVDRVWFTRDEASSLVPQNMEIGNSYPMPAHLARRLAKLHFVDIARGESPRWRSEDLKQVEIVLTPQQISANRVTLCLEGTVRNEASPSMSINPFNHQKVDMPRGIELQLIGDLTYNRRETTFEKFDAIAVGNRWGATTYNARFDDLGPAPIGFAFELGSNSAVDRTPPQAIRSRYFEAG